jgi:hypothetical protein
VTPWASFLTRRARAAGRWPLLLVILAATTAIALTAVDGAPAASDGSEIRTDSFNVNGTPVELANGYPVPYVSDCDPGESPPRCGAPAAQWSAARRPVEFCTFTTNLPQWLGIDQFRQYVRESAEVWNNVESAIGVNYVGDCQGVRWERRDGVNQIAFDDSRNVLSGSTLGLTESSISWSPPTNPTIRRIDEADIIIESTFASVPTCLRSTVTHEMGHALGFGHSTNSDDIMYLSVDLARPDTCHLEPSASEEQRLQDLYGVDLLPSVSIPTDQAIPIGLQMTLHATANDPEGQPLAFEWQQLSGEPVELVGDGSAVHFRAPNNAGISQFRVTVTDPYMHPASAFVNVTTYVSQGRFTYGAIPPAGGYELVIFAGGTNLDLLAAAGCPYATVSFWATNDAGAFVIYLPASTVDIVNAAWNEKFPGDIPAGTPLLGSCV